MKSIINSAAIISLCSLMLACSGDDDNNSPTSSDNSIYDIASSNSELTTLTAALEATGLNETLDAPSGRYTVFAPTDAAFALLGQETINALLADTETLSDILTYHVVPRRILDANDVTAEIGRLTEMANGDDTAISRDDADLFINYSLITSANIEADNGIIHIIDTVLTPPDLSRSNDNIVETAIANGNFTTLVAALGASGLDAVLADETQTFTVFAPTDAAFDLLPTGTVSALLSDTEALSSLLLQHVISGAAVDSLTAAALDGQAVRTASDAYVDVELTDRMLTIGGAMVTLSDIRTVNGVIHVIDRVIVGDVDVPQPSIVDVAREAGGFTTLVTALEATGLDAVLNDLDETYTVFAPTDAAFAELGQETITSLLADPDTLANILTYHVIADASIGSTAAINAASSSMPKVPTVNSASVGLSLNNGNLFVNLAQVIAPDVMATNGIIHGVNKVILPPAAMGTPSMNIVETATAAGSFATLLTALDAASLTSVLENESETFTVFAPTDAAFDLIPSATLNALIADVPALTDVLLQHVIIGAAVDSVTAFTLNNTNVNTAANEDVSIEIVNGMLQIQGSNVTTYDIYTNNGVIHVIDAVITETLQ